VSLTGSPFGAAVTIVALLTFGAVVVGWPRLAGSGLAPILARTGLLVALNVLVLGCVAVQLNDKYLFFADWADLDGALGGHLAATPISRGAVGGSAAVRPVRGRAAVPSTVLPALPPPAGRPQGVITSTVRGALSGLTGTVIVRLPPGYTWPDRATVRYPVLETFSGYPGAPTQWLRTMSLGDAVDTAVAAGQLRPLLVVSPQVEFPRGVDTECVDGAPGPAVETWLTRDVPDWVARTYRVSGDRASWATIGLSAGGWCAAMATMLHPAQYSAAVVMGGYFSPWFGPNYEGVRPGSPGAARYDLVAVARRPPPVALWLETSHSDPMSYTSSARFLKGVRPPLSVDAVVLRNAGHRIAIWRDLLPQALTWLGRTVPGFRPSG